MRRSIPLLSLLLAGCPGLGQVAFDVDSPGQSTVRGSPAGGLLPTFPGFPAFGGMTFSQNQSFANNNTNQQKIRIAEALTIPSGVESIDLTIDDQELAPYAKADSFSITTTGTASVPPQDTTIEADLTLHIVANVL